MYRTAFLFLCLETCINQPRASASNYCASLFALLTLLSKGTPKYEREASDSIKNDNELSDKTKNHDVVQGKISAFQSPLTWGSSRIFHT